MDIYSNYKFYHLDITLPSNSQENDVYTIVEKLRPKWKRSDVQIERVTGGFLNRTYSCLHKDDLDSQDDGLFVRLNGKNREAVERILIHKEHEIRYVKELNACKIGAPLLATFSNGLVLKLMKGKMLSAEDIQDPKLEREIARILTKIHAIQIPVDMPRCWQLKEGLLVS